MSEESQPLISNIDHDRRNHSSFLNNVRESPDTSSEYIGGGPMGGDSGIKASNGTESDKISNNPLSDLDLANRTSNWDTMVHLLKGNIGTGILAMPDAFRNAGWLVGIFGTMFMAIVCTHCMHILVYCSKELCLRLNVPKLGFADVAETAFETGPSKFRRCSKFARFLVNAFLVITQFGFCCVYFVFVATNFRENALLAFCRNPDTQRVTRVRGEFHDRSSHCLITEDGLCALLLLKKI